MTGQKVTREEEQIFMNEMVNSPDLYRYIRNHKDDYHLFSLSPICLELLSLAYRNVWKKQY